MQEKLRRIALAHQGLTVMYPFGKGLDASRRVLHHLHYVQIDTLSVVERAHHHTLWSRNPDYRPEHLDQMVLERSAFEYWSHAASYLPMRDYRFALPKMMSIRRGESSYFKNVDRKCERDVYERIRIDGPLRARDFESSSEQSGSWWNWKPTKRALEKLFMQGDLMITRREGMQKVYDLTERVLPADTDVSEPSNKQLAQYLLEAALCVNGFATVKQLTYLRSGKALRKSVQAVLNEKIEQGELAEFQAQGVPLVYAQPEIFETRIRIPSTSLRLLSPFDNAIIHRDMLSNLFSMDYKLECYVPKQKRQYGYFCLPILWKDNLIGRVDCKAHRKNHHLELLHLHLEDPKLDLESFMPAFLKGVKRFAVFNGCDKVSVLRVSPGKLKPHFHSAFKAILD